MKIRYLYVLMAIVATVFALLAASPLGYLMALFGLLLVISTFLWDDL